MLHPSVLMVAVGFFWQAVVAHVQLRNYGDLLGCSVLLRFNQIVSIVFFLLCSVRIPRSANLRNAFGVDSLRM